MIAPEFDTLQQAAREAARRFSAKWMDLGYLPTALYAYTDLHGKPLYWRFRLDHPDYPTNSELDKIVRPLHHIGPGPDDFACSMPKVIPADGWLLLGQARLAARPDDPVFVTEGEKCAEALENLWLLAVTSGNSQSADGANWNPLRGRSVIIWPDNDRGGLVYARNVTAKLQALGCTVEWIDIAALDLPEKGDCVDWLAAHPNAMAMDILALRRIAPPVDTMQNSATRNQASVSTPMTTAYSQIEPKPVRWLWKNRLPRGKMTTVAGNPALGKSQITIDMAARVSSGGCWPITGEKCEPGDVLIISAEDDAADTIRPRLDAAGADVNRCYHFQVPGFSLDEMEKLEHAVEKMSVPPTLIIIDPISAYMGSADSNKNAEVRATLARLAEFAAAIDAAVILVSHLNKSGGGDAIYRVTGSLAFVAAVRGAFLVVKDPDDPDKRLFLPLKNNLSDDDSGYAFTIESYTLESGIETSRIVWESERIFETVDEVMERQRNVQPESNNQGGAFEDAKTFLREFLAAGPKSVTEVKDAGVSAGQSWITLRRASDALEIAKVKEKKKNGQSIWSLPATKGKKVEDAHVDHDIPPEKVEHLPHGLHAVPDIHVSEVGEDAQEAQGAHVTEWDEDKV